MEEITLSWAAAAMRAAYGSPLDGEPIIIRICTDSRQAAPGALFFALKGEHADGHSYAPDALAKGASVVVSAPIHAASEEPGATQLVVPNPLLALGDLARAYRSQFDAKVVGITGSVGKTSTREMTAHVLRTRYNVLASEKNYNNEIGVPLTLFGLNRAHQAAVVEMGMRAPGEIRTLAVMAHLKVAIITNVGFAHLELLGSRNAIAEAKAEILENLPPDGVAILPDNLPYPNLFESALPAGCRLVRVGGPGADVWAEALEARSDGAFTAHVKMSGETALVNVQAPGAHHRLNALITIAAALEFDIPLDESSAALSTWRGADGRMTALAGLHGTTVLDDCYNAGPESMAAALETLHAHSGSRVAVLGDMRELGKTEAELHQLLGRNVIDADLRLLVTVGPLAGLIADRAISYAKSAQQSVVPAVARFASTFECEESISELVRSGDTILVKGSRSMQMEHIVARLVGRQIAGHHG